MTKATSIGDHNPDPNHPPPDTARKSSRETAAEMHQDIQNSGAGTTHTSAKDLASSKRKSTENNASEHTSRKTRSGKDASQSEDSMLDNVLIPELKRVLSEELGAVDKVEVIQRLAKSFKEELAEQIDELVAERLQAIETEAAEDRSYKRYLSRRYAKLRDNILYLKKRIAMTKREMIETRRELEAVKAASMEKNRANLHDIARLAAEIKKSQTNIEDKSQTSNTHAKAWIELKAKALRELFGDIKGLVQNFEGSRIETGLLEELQAFIKSEE